MQFAEKYFTNLKRTSTSSDDMGRPAVEWKYKGTSIGTYVDYTDLIATYTAGVDQGDLYTLIGKSTVEDIQDTKDDTAHVEVYLNGEPVTDEDAYKNGKFFVKSSTTDLAGTGNGVITEVFLDDEYGKDEDETMVTIVIAQTFLMQATNDYSSSKESLNVEYIEIGGSTSSAGLSNTQPGIMPTSIDQDDFDVSGYDEDDYLIVTYSKSAKEIQSVEPAELLVGEIDTYKHKDSVTVDGTKYKYNYLTDRDEEFDTGSNATLVLDPYGYVIYVDEADSSSSYVYITRFGSSSNLSSQAKATAYFTDGTDDTIDVKKVTYYDSSSSKNVTVEKGSTISGWYTDYAHAGWYTYSVNSSDQYTLKSVACKNDDYRTYSKDQTFTGDSSSVVDIVYSETVSFLNSTTNNVKGNSDTLFLVLDEDEDLDVYTGINNAPDVSLTASADVAQKVIVSWVGDSSYADYVFIDASRITNETYIDIDGTNSSDDYLFVLYNDTKVIKNGDDNYSEMDVLLDGETTTVQVDEGDHSNFTVGALYHKLKTETSTGFYQDATEINASYTSSHADYKVETGVNSTSKAIDYNSGTLLIGNEEFVLASDADIYMIVKGCEDTEDLLDDDGADYEVYAHISGRNLESNLNGYKYTYDYYAVLDDDDSDIVDILYVYITAAEETTSSTGSSSSNSSIKGTKNVKLSTPNDLKDELNGAYTFNVGDLGSYSGLTNVDATNIESIIFFKFTTVTASKDTYLYIYDGDDLMYVSEKVSDFTVGGHYFYVHTQPATTHGSNTGSGYLNSHDWPTGDYTWKVIEDGTQIASGSFSID